MHAGEVALGAQSAHREIPFPRVGIDPVAFPCRQGLGDALRDGPAVQAFLRAGVDEQVVALQRFRGEEGDRRRPRAPVERAVAVAHPPVERAVLRQAGDGLRGQGFPRLRVLVEVHVAVTLPDVGQRRVETVDVVGHLPLALAVERARGTAAERRGGEDDTLRRLRRPERRHGGGGRHGLVRLGHHEAVRADVVERLGVVATAEPLDGELGGVAGLHVDRHEAPVVGGDLELVVVELRPLAPVVDGTAGRGHVNPKVLVLQRLPARIAVGVPEEVDARLAARRGEGLELADDLPGKVALARRPELGLMGVVELGEDEIDVVERTGRLEDPGQPIQLLGPVVGAVRIEAHEADVAIVLVPPMLLEPLRPVLGQVEILEVVGRIDLVVAEDRIQRYLREQVVGGGEEVVGPLPVAVAVDDEVAGNQHERDLIGGLTVEVAEHPVVDDLVEDVGVAAALLHVAHRDEGEVGFRAVHGGCPEAVGQGRNGTARHAVEVGRGRVQAVDEHIVHRAAGRGRSDRRDAVAQILIRPPFEDGVPFGRRFPHHADGSRFGVLQVGFDVELPEAGQEGKAGGQEGQRKAHRRQGRGDRQAAMGTGYADAMAARFVICRHAEHDLYRRTAGCRRDGLEQPRSNCAGAVSSALRNPHFRWPHLQYGADG